MTANTASDRHLSRSGLDDYLGLAAPATIVVPGAPTCRITIDAPRRVLQLTMPYRNDPLDVTEFENVTSRVISGADGYWQELLVRYQEQPHEAYLLLCDIADMVQLADIAFPVATRSALDTFSELLTRKRSLSAERQIGLYGELLLLESLLTQLPATAAIEAWKGYAPNEHDFVLNKDCVEVKTTKSERRQHRIGSLEQLQPMVGSSLWLVSVQLTSSTTAAGRTLGGVIEDVRDASGSARSQLNAQLDQAGWRERDRALYTEHLVLRSRPTAYKVDSSFPVLSRTVVDAGCTHPELITEASYTVDVTSLSPSTPPPLECFVNGDPERCS